MGDASDEGFYRANEVPGCVMVDNGIALSILLVVEAERGVFPNTKEEIPRGRIWWSTWVRL